MNERGIDVAAVVPTDIFDWIDWQAVRRPDRDKVVAITARRGSAPASVNRRAAAVRAFFEHQVMAGTRDGQPGAGSTPGPRAAAQGAWRARSSRTRAGPARGAASSASSGGCPSRLNQRDVSAFLADLGTHRDRAIVLLMVFGGLRAAEVRSLRLADVDQGRRQVRVLGKGGRERTVPVDRAFFSELAAYLRVERPPGL